MKASPQLAQFFGNTLPGIETLLDNVDIRGIDALKAAVAQFMQQSQQQQKQMQQMQMQQAQAPLMIQQQKLQLDAQRNQQDFAIKSGQLDIQNKQADTDRLTALAQIGEKADKIEIEQDKLDAEQARTDVASINAMANMADTAHQHTMDLLKLHHENDQFEKNLEKENKQMQQNQNVSRGV
jgi:hypothetical protein